MVSLNSQIGIGTTSPGKILKLREKFKLVDGSQSNDYFLTSDASGNGS
ncbi:hypothetical protein [Dysgonomonas sp. HGC4]|nr:hypothetical protein [Dysgonomonas sp. HGC4]MBD8347829.1 hypothetical protein [Dysgonomonas sp. HGC4]